MDSSFTVRKALNGRDGYVSFESVNYPNRFIRHAGYVLWLHEPDGSDLFKNDASFRIVGAKNGADGYFSVESSNYPNYFIRHENFRCKISPEINTPLFNEDASWKTSTISEFLQPKIGSKINFQSHNYPSYFMKERNSEIWID